MRDHHVVLVTTSPALHEVTRELATRLAARANAVLVFLHVTPLRPRDGEAMLYGALDLAGGEGAAWARALTPTDGSVRFRHRVEAGEPEARVARFVEDHDVDLVVIEEPPRGWIAASLWRGLAERLIRRLDCPVVIGGPGFLRSAPPAVAPVTAPLDEATVAELLEAMVEARVDALRSWMDHAADAARRIADTEVVRTAVRQARAPGGRVDARTERILAVELEEHRRALRGIGWRLVAGGTAWGHALPPPVEGSERAAFLARVRAHGQSTSLPLAREGEDGLVVLAAARVGEDGLLSLAFDAEAEFLRILGQPGPLPTFETYAFDQQGLMLSNSRFPDHLLAAGLLPEGVQTPLQLRVAEPSDGPADAWPLTLSARQATRESDGCNTRGYLDYRGKPVVGAWRWVGEYGFGVAAEVDRDAAHLRR